MKTDYSDQIKLFDPDTWGYPVHIIGAGGICNLLGITLRKMGIHSDIHIWDDDVLERRNCPTEVGYSYKMIGQPKVAAMADAVNYMMGTTDADNHILQHQTRLTKEDELSGIVISGVDSMASRKIIWECVSNPDNAVFIPLYIDARSAGLVTQIFALSPTDYDMCENYETWLFKDEDAMKLACGARNYPPAALYFAYAISNVLAKWQRGETIAFRTSLTL